MEYSFPAIIKFHRQSQGLKKMWVYMLRLKVTNWKISLADQTSLSPEITRNHAYSKANFGRR